MYDTTNLSVPKHAERIFNMFLLLYPETYSKRYGSEMQLVFSELYQEELEKNGHVGVRFWLSQISDMTKSIIEQHIDEIGKKGMKQYLQQTLHLNRYNIVSILFLLPVTFMIGIEIMSRIVQGDLLHYNRPLYAFFSHTFLYWTPVLFTWVILFPLLAVLISLIPILISLSQKKTSLFSWNFVKRNVMGLLILVFGIGFIALIKLHDFVPCMVHGIAHVGFGKFTHIVAVCRKA